MNSVVNCKFLTLICSLLSIEPSSAAERWYPEEESLSDIACGNARPLKGLYYKLLTIFILLVNVFVSFSTSRFAFLCCRAFRKQCYRTLNDPFAQNCITVYLYCIMKTISQNEMIRDLVKSNLQLVFDVRKFALSVLNALFELESSDSYSTLCCHGTSNSFICYLRIQETLVFHKMTHSNTFSLFSLLYHHTCISTDMCICSWHGNYHKIVYEWEFSVVKL